MAPISSDSMSLISSWLSHRERTAAVIHPAVPPPTIVTDLVLSMRERSGYPSRLVNGGCGRLVAQPHLGPPRRNREAAQHGVADRRDDERGDVIGRARNQSD